MKSSPLYLILLVSIIFSSHTFSQSDKNLQFIQVTTNLTWADGIECSVGEIELVHDYTKDSYIIRYGGKSYSIKRTYARKISSDKAALTLLRRKEQLNRQLASLTPRQKMSQNTQPTAQQQLAMLEQLQKISNGTGVTQQELAIIQQLTNPSNPGNNTVETQISGTFKGWDGSTIFKLTNGQIWQQSSYAYTYHYAYQPAVIIYNTTAGYKMKVDGVDSTIYVKRIK